MFGGAEMVRGNFNDEDKEKVSKILRQLSSAIEIEIPNNGLYRGQVPFVKPVNFVVVYSIDFLHLIVDNIPIGGIPDHTYIDKRDLGVSLSIEDLVNESIQELGFRQPLGISIPVLALSEDEKVSGSVIGLMAKNICKQLAASAKIDRLKIPSGYQQLSRYVPAFLNDHPNVEKNVFLIMRFKNGEQYKVIENTIRQQLGNTELCVMRADEKDYTGDLWENVCLYMIGCTYGIAIFEEIDEREFNPSVALELGFMLANNKRCLLLKDQRMPKLPTDILGKLYKTFDTYKIESSLSDAIDAWINDIGLKKG
jgi:hypothetical protein